MNIPDYFSESLETVLGSKVPKLFDADPDPGPVIFLTLNRDPGRKIGSGINIHPRSVTLVIINMFLRDILFQFARSIGARAGGPPVPERGGCARGQLHLERSAATASPLRLIYNI